MTKPVRIDAEGTEDTMSGRMDTMGSFKGPIEPERRGQWYRPIPPGASITSGDRFIPNEEPTGTDSHDAA